MIKAQQKQVLDQVAGQLAILGFRPEIAHRPHDLIRQQGDIQQRIDLRFRNYGGWIKGSPVYQESYTILLFVEIRHEPLQALIRQTLNLKRDVFGPHTLYIYREGWIERRDVYSSTSYMRITTFAEALQQTLDYFEQHHSPEAILDGLIKKMASSSLYFGHYPLPLWTLGMAYLTGQRDVFEATAKRAAMENLPWPNYPYCAILARILRARFDT